MVRFLSFVGISTTISYLNICFIGISTRMGYLKPSFCCIATYADACRIMTSDTVLRKIYLSLYLKGSCVRGSWRPNRTAKYWPPLLWPSVFLSRSPGLLNREPGAQPLWMLVFSTASYLSLVWSPNCSIGGLRAPSAGCWLSLPHLVCNWLNFLSTELNNSSMPTFFLWPSQIALIQPIHGQGYTLLFLNRMHLLFT